MGGEIFMVMHTTWQVRMVAVTVIASGLPAPTHPPPQDHIFWFRFLVPNSILDLTVGSSVHMAQRRAPERKHLIVEKCLPIGRPRSVRWRAAGLSVSVGIAHPPAATSSPQTLHTHICL